MSNTPKIAILVLGIFVAGSVATVRLVEGLNVDPIAYQDAARIPSGFVGGDISSDSLLFYNGRSLETPYEISVAVKTDGAWETFGEPILSPGPVGAFDDAHVKDPYAVRSGERLDLYYAGHDGETFRIGHASSYDGLTWAKRGPLFKGQFPVVDGNRMWFSRGNTIRYAEKDGTWKDRGVVIRRPYDTFPGDVIEVDGETHLSFSERSGMEWPYGHDAYLASFTDPLGEYEVRKVVEAPAPYHSVFLRTLERTPDGFVAYATAWNEEYGRLREVSVEYRASSLFGPWLLKGRVIPFGTWDTVSAENPSLTSPDTRERT